MHSWHLLLPILHSHIPPRAVFSIEKYTRTRGSANWAGTRFRAGLSMFSLGDARTTETTEGWLAVQDCAKKKEYIDECSFTLKSIKFLFTWASTSGAPGLKIFREAVLKSPGCFAWETWPKGDRRFYPTWKQWQQIGRQGNITWTSEARSRTRSQVRLLCFKYWFRRLARSN